jgi:hypothetical protein
MTNAALDPDLEKFIGKLLMSGRFPSREAALSDGASLVEAYSAKLALFDDEMKGALSSSVSGFGIGVHEAFDELDAYIEGFIKKKAA